MTRSKLSLLVLVTSLLASSTSAQDVDVRSVCAPHVAVRRAVLDHEGRSGVWFDLDVARCMLARLDMLPRLSDLNRTLESRITIADRRYQLRVEASTLADEIMERYRTALVASESRADAAERRLASWHRSPVLWLMVGVVLSALLVGLSAYALR